MIAIRHDDKLCLDCVGVNVTDSLNGERGGNLVIHGKSDFLIIKFKNYSEALKAFERICTAIKIGQNYIEV